MKEIHLTTEAVTDTDRVIALKCAWDFAKHLGWPKEEYYVEPLAIAFLNGVSYARQCADPEVQEGLREQCKPIVDDLFGKE